jgi:hypothetical protein
VRKTPAIALLIVIMAAGTASAAEIAETPFLPLSPEIMGRGGSFIADAHGYNSFFYNPAGFSRESGSFTLGDAAIWVHARPDELVALGTQVASGTVTPLSVLGFLNNQVTTGGVGFGASFGIGYVGNGLGLGVVLIEDSILYGPTLLDMRGDLTFTVGFIGGLSVPFDVLGMKVHVGGDVRPMIRAHALLDSVASNLITALISGGSMLTVLDGAHTVYGVGIGLDLGAIAELGWFTFGLSVRDLGGTQFKYNLNTFGTVLNALATQVQFPAGTAVTADQYVIPMDIALGIGLHPDMGSLNFFFDPSLSVDLHNLAGALAGATSVWALLHAGLELKLLNIFSLRAGYSGGFLSLGAGLKLFILDMNFAVFTRELGANIGDRSSSGASLNVAIRW